MNIGRFRQAHVAVASTFGTFVMGVITAWPSYTSEIFLSEANTPLSTAMTQSEEALLGSLPAMGALVGSGLVGLATNKFGRRYGGIIMYAPALISWIIVSLTTSVNCILAARFLGGITGGAALILSPTFISEVAEDAIRGTLASACMFMYSGGVLVSYVIGTTMAYYPIIWVNLFLNTTCLIVLALVTESPVYLLRNNREEDAKLSIAKYRGVPVSSKIVMDELSKLKQQLTPSVELVSVTEVDPKATEAEMETLKQYDIEPEKPQSMSAAKLIFLQPSSRRAFVIVSSITLIQLFMGPVPVQVYAKTVFNQADPSMADINTILFAVVMFAGSGVTVLVTDRAGRRLLLISSSLMVFVIMTALGYLVQTKSGPPFVIVILLFAYIFFFMYGAGSIPLVLLAEVFIPEVQNFASMVIIEALWACISLTIGAFPIINNAFGIHGSFYLFGVVGLICAAISYVYLPETKGLSNTQIQDAFMPRKKN